MPGAPALGLEQRDAPRTPAARRVESFLPGCTFEIAYPGIWLRDDVYATHGHHMDPHLTLPRAECVAAAAVARGRGGLSDPAAPAEYERLLAPVYGLTFGLARAGIGKRAGGAARPSERAFTWLARSSRNGGARGRVARVAGGTGLKAATAAVNRLLGSEFEPDVSVAGINRGGIRAGTEPRTRQRHRARPVTTGHNPRAGPGPGARRARRARRNLR